MPDAATERRLSQEAVEAGIRALGKTRLKTQADAMLRTFLAFNVAQASSSETGTAALRDIVSELFTVLPTPYGVDEEHFKGTLRLRGSGGRPSWMNNDSYRGSFLDYAGPTSPGRRLFESDHWRNPLRDDAVSVVVSTLGNADRWPPRDALAVVVLRDQSLNPNLGWDALMELARERLALSPSEWGHITSDPVLTEVQPFEADPWSADKLASDLRPPGTEHAQQTENVAESQPPHLAAAIQRVLAALNRHGDRAVVALAGVPGTSKSHVARISARAYASPDCLREIQFSPGYTYEEFVEGPRFGDGLKVTSVSGAFLELNDRALEEPDKQFVLLIEELSRADLPKVLGELLTYVEYRGEEDTFTTMYRREVTTRVAPNLAILATYNPADRSAVVIDAAIIRRLRILAFPPALDLLAELLTGNGVDPAVIAQLVAMFEACRAEAGPDRFDEVMPFGHAVFSSVESEADLHDLWHEELRHMLIRPHTPRHQLHDTIKENYPWHQGADVTVVGQSEGADPQAPAHAMPATSGDPPAASLAAPPLSTPDEPAG